MHSSKHHRYPCKTQILIFFGLLVLLLTAWAAPVLASPLPKTTTGSVVQQQTGSHPPAILRVKERQEVANGYLWFYYDIYFTDPDGDAAALTYAVIASSLPYPLTLTDAPIEASAEEQQTEALYTEVTACWQKMDLTYEGRIRDSAGNLSEPVRFRLSCSAPVALDTTPFLVSGLVTAAVIGVLLLLGFWLLFRQRPAERLPALRSTLLFTGLFMFVRFVQLIVHEGGHSLYSLVNNLPTMLYVHPFLFRGFSRPIISGSGIWKDVLGSAAALPLALLIFLLFWKRRSTALLPLVMIFPVIALTDGYNVMGIQDDFRNLVQATGLPAAPFLILGALIFCLGLLSFLSLFPLMGMDPGDNKALFALPAGMFMGSVLSLLVAHIFVLGSPIHQDYFMGWEILSDNFFLFYVPFGLFFALLYVTLFRKLYPHLPGWLRTETVTLTWKDLRLPGLLWAASVVIGLMIII